MRIYSVSVFFKKFSRLRPPTKCNDDFKVICSKRKLNGKLSREWMNGVVSKGRVSSRDKKCRQNNRRMCKILILWLDKQNEVIPDQLFPNSRAISAPTGVGFILSYP